MEPRTPGVVLPDSLFRHEAWLDYRTAQGWKREGEGCLHRPLGPELSLAYLHGQGKGPLPSEDGYGNWLEQRSLEREEDLPRNCACLRWDLTLPDWSDGEGRALPPRLRELRMNFGSGARRLRKAEVEPYPVDTMLVDLFADEEVLWARLAPSTRYAIRTGASRGGEALEEGRDGLPAFCDLYAETARRNGLPRAKASLFARLFECAEARGLSLRLYAVRDRGGKAVASAVYAACGKEAWYLFAASSSTGRELCGPSLIMWRAMLDLKLAGCTELDLLGVGPPGCADHPLARLTHFKKGFGGRRVRRLGAWDWVIDEEAYEDLRRRELTAFASSLRGF